MRHSPALRAISSSPSPSPDALPSSYLLLEHKSYPDRWVSLQLAGYILRIWEKSRTLKPPPKFLPPVIPLVVHHGPNGWTAPSQLINLVDPVAESIPELTRLTPSFVLLVDDLTRASDEELLSRAIGLYAQLTAFFLRDARTPERVPQTLRQLAGLLRELWAAPDGPRAITILMRHLCVVSEADRAEVTKAVQQSLPEAQELIMTIAEQLRQEGLQQGLQRGQVQTLRKLLSLRFGELDEATLTRLESADAASLDRYAERLLTASSIDELFADCNHSALQRLTTRGPRAPIWPSTWGPQAPSTSQIDGRGSSVS